MRPTTDPDLRSRATALGFHGLLARWEEIAHEPWLPVILDIEQTERQRRSLERRLLAAKLTAMKPLVDFDWKHPKAIDRALVDELFELQFLRECTNVVFLGPNGVGKTMLAQNLAHHAVLRGFTARFTTAPAMLGDLDAQDGALALRRRLHRYVKPALLVIDELGYLPQQQPLRRPALRGRHPAVPEGTDRHYNQSAVQRVGRRLPVRRHAPRPSLPPRRGRPDLRRVVAPQGGQRPQLPPARPRIAATLIGPFLDRWPALSVGASRRRSAPALLVGVLHRHDAGLSEHPRHDAPLDFPEPLPYLPLVDRRWLSLGTASYDTER
jgi:hypothetical protein